MLKWSGKQRVSPLTLLSLLFRQTQGGAGTRQLPPMLAKKIYFFFAAFFLAFFFFAIVQAPVKE